MLRRREQSVCPCCGQRILIRHGVKLSPMRADLFDMIERCGEAGVTSEVLIGVFWPGKDIQAARACLKSNILLLNGMLEETDYEVRAGSGGNHDKPYRVVKRRV